MNKKTFLVALALGASWLSGNAADPVKMHLNISGTPNGSSPLTLETEHYLTQTVITHNVAPDGTVSITLHANEGAVTYPLAYGKNGSAQEGVEYITHLAGAPTIALSANQDPDNQGNYYTTFYSSLEAYTLPADITAYTAVKNNNYARLQKLAEGGTAIPKGTAVLLHSTNDISKFNMSVATSSSLSNPNSNIFRGKDLRTLATDGNYYIFTYGQDGVAFYKKKDANPLLANKAYIDSSDMSVSAFILQFEEEEGIDAALIDDVVFEGDIYSVSGVQLSKPQQGVNIIGGKKVLIK